MRAEGGGQVQVPKVMTVMINDVLRPCFLLYISLKPQGNEHGPFKTAWYLLCSQVVSYLLKRGLLLTYC